MSRILLLACFLPLIVTTRGQFFHKPGNRLDENGKRTGKWVTYWDEDKKVPMSKAWFEDGREKVVSKEYHVNGKLRLKFRYHKDRIRVKYYKESRRIEQKGWSVIEYSEKDTHYYWQGKWKFYGEKHKVERIAYYHQGEEVSPP